MAHPMTLLSAKYVRIFLNWDATARIKASSGYETLKEVQKLASCQSMCSKQHDDVCNALSCHNVYYANTPNATYVYIL